MSLNKKDETGAHCLTICLQNDVSLIKLVRLIDFSFKSHAKCENVTVLNEKSLKCVHFEHLQVTPAEMVLMG